MRPQQLATPLLTILAGVFTLALMFTGIRSAFSIDFHFNPVLSVLYCALPILSLPVYLFTLRYPSLAAFQATLAIAYLAVYSALNWRTCSSLGYCGSVASTVLLTLKTRPVLAYSFAAILSLAASALRHRPEARANQKI